MKSDKRQTMSLIGVALLAAAGVLLYVALSQPKVYESAPAPQASFTAEAEETQIRVTYPLNINTATAEELATVNGLGEKKAAAIIEYRDVIGGYDSVSQIMEIKGFGEGLYNEIAPYLTV